MSLFTPDFGLLFWMVLCFGIVLAVLAKWGFPVILQAVNSRKAFIEESMEQARNARESLADLEQQRLATIQKAREESMQILKEAQLQKAQILAQAKDEAQQLGQRMIEDTKAELSRRRDEGRAKGPGGAKKNHRTRLGHGPLMLPTLDNS